MNPLHHLDLEAALWIVVLVSAVVGWVVIELIIWLASHVVIGWT